MWRALPLEACGDFPGSNGARSSCRANTGLHILEVTGEAREVAGMK
jgi:hypothetical protein